MNDVIFYKLKTFIILLHGNSLTKLIFITKKVFTHRKLKKSEYKKYVEKGRKNKCAVFILYINYKNEYCLRNLNT